MLSGFQADLGNISEEIKFVTLLTRLPYRLENSPCLLITQIPAGAVLLHEREAAQSKGTTPKDKLRSSLRVSEHTIVSDADACV